MKFSLKDPAISEYKQIVKDFVAEVQSANQKLSGGLNKSINKTKFEPLYKELNSFVSIYNQVMIVDIGKKAIKQWVESDRSLSKDMNYYSVGDVAEDYCRSIESNLAEIFSDAFKIETIAKPNLNGAEINNEDYTELKELTNQYSKAIKACISNTIHKIKVNSENNDIFYSLEQLILIIQGYLDSFDEILRKTIDSIHKLSIDGQSKTKKLSEDNYAKAVKQAQDTEELVKSLKDEALTRKNKSQSSNGGNGDSRSSSGGESDSADGNKVNLDKDLAKKEPNKEEPNKKEHANDLDKEEPNKEEPDKSDKENYKTDKNDKKSESNDKESNKETKEKLKGKVVETAKKGTKNILNNIVDNIDKKSNGENNVTANKDNEQTPVKRGINIDFSIDANNSFNKNRRYGTGEHIPYSGDISDDYTQNNENSRNNVEEITPRINKVQKQRRQIKLPTIPPEAWEVAGKALDLMIETQANVSPVGAAVKTAIPIAKDIASIVGGLDTKSLKPIQKAIQNDKSTTDSNGSNNKKSPNTTIKSEIDKTNQDNSIPNIGEENNKNTISTPYRDANKNVDNTEKVHKDSKPYVSNTSDKISRENHANTGAKINGYNTSDIEPRKINKVADIYSNNEDEPTINRGDKNNYNKYTDTPIYESNYEDTNNHLHPNIELHPNRETYSKLTPEHTEIRESIIEKVITHEKITENIDNIDGAVEFNKDEEFITGDYNSNFVMANFVNTRTYTSIESLLINSIQHASTLIAAVTGRLCNCNKLDLENLIKLFNLVDNIYLTLSESLCDIIDNTINYNIRNIENNSDTKYIVLNNLLKNDITRASIINNFGSEVIQFIDDLSQYSPADISILKSVIELLYKNKFNGKLDKYEMKLLADLDTKWKYFTDSQSFINKMRLICYAECYLEYNNKAKEFENEQIMCDIWRDLIEAYLSIIGTTDADKKYLNKFYTMIDTKYKWKPRLNHINLKDYFRM